MQRIVFMPLLLLLLLFLALNNSIARADNLEEFKAAVKRYNESLIHWDVDIIADIESDAVGFSFGEQYITDHKLLIKELWKKELKELISQYEYYDIEIVTSQAKVIGNTGIACGNFKVSRKHREYPWISAKKRWSSTWVKQDGQWKLAFYHFEYVDAWR